MNKTLLAIAMFLLCNSAAAQVTFLDAVLSPYGPDYLIPVFVRTDDSAGLVIVNRRSLRLYLKESGVVKQSDFVNVVREAIRRKKHLCLKGKWKAHDFWPLGEVCAGARIDNKDDVENYIAPDGAILRKGLPLGCVIYDFFKLEIASEIGDESGSAYCVRKKELISSYEYYKKIAQRVE